jgi:hypothetical protein
MSDMDRNMKNGTSDDSPAAERGGFVALAVLAAALGAGAALLLAPDEGGKTRKRVGRGLRSLRGDAADSVAQLREKRRRKDQSRREKQVMAVAGLLVGAGVAALLTPGRGAQVRQRLSGTLGRIRVGAVDRIERLRQREANAEPPTASVSESP